MFAPRYIIVHCANTPDGSDKWRTWHIDDWHRQRGFYRSSQRSGPFRHIGYHYVIETDGKVVPGRDEDEVGAHCRGRNDDSFGVCLMGKGKFTFEQWKALREIVMSLSDRYGGLRVYGHRTFNDQKTCPGFDVEEWLMRAMSVLDQHLV